jgi:cytochrome c oxidase subunit 2
VTPSQLASALDPRGPAAAEVATLWWVLLAVGGVVFGVVVMLLALAVVRRRGAELVEPAVPTDQEEASGRRWVLVGGALVPALILAVMLVLTLRSMAALASAPRPAELTIDVVGRMWWWEVRYPDAGFATANEIHVPVGRAVELRLSSADVIHSFWVPQLGGKMDLVPGRTNTTWLQADQPGTYRGRCAEFCGLQHAKMDLLVVAHPPDEYAAWLERERRPAVDPTDPTARAGMQLFMQPSCVRCHTIRGTPAQGTEGPDLTHVGDRRMIAGGALPRNVGTLAGWIADPQGNKPGNLMPDDRIDVESARRIAVYLDGLK